MGWLRGADGRLQPTLRVALYLPAFLLTALLLGTVPALLLAPELFAWPRSGSDALVGPTALAFAASSALAAALSTWIFRRLVDRRPWTGLGLSLARGWLTELGRGFGLGAALMGAVAAVELGFGWYRLDGLAPAESAVRDVALGLLLHAAVGFGEELVTRGYMLQTLAETWGSRWSAVISSALFGLFHLANPGGGVTPVLGVFWAGLMLAGGYLATRRLWLPIGLHWAWNFFQGPVFGFPVSGTGAGGLLRVSAVGSEPLSGGQFGPEASLVGVAACLLGTAVLWHRAGKAGVLPLKG